jgi:hypothetical protein
MYVQPFGVRYRTQLQCTIRWDYTCIYIAVELEASEMGGINKT